MSVRRSLVAVTPEDSASWQSGRPWLWGYGLGYVCKIAGVTRRCARKAHKDRGIDLGDPVTAVAWALSKQGHRDLAAAVMDAFGRKKGWGR